MNNVFLISILFLPVIKTVNVNIVVLQSALGTRLKGGGTSQFIPNAHHFQNQEREREEVIVTLTSMCRLHHKHRRESWLSTSQRRPEGQWDGPVPSCLTRRTEGAYYAMVAGVVVLIRIIAKTFIFQMVASSRLQEGGGPQGRDAYFGCARKIITKQR